MMEQSPDSFRERFLLGLKEGELSAVRRARETGTMLVIWQDGKVVRVTPDEFERLQSNAEKNSS